jgi:asparagine synthase (glutamine-hydrolysing)
MIDRPKQGFAVPIGDWIRGPLRPWAEDLLDESTLRRQGIFDADAVRGVWRRHRAGSGKGMELWGLLMFQAWFDSNMSGRA